MIAVMVEGPSRKRVGAGRVPVGRVQGPVVDRLVRGIADILHNVGLAAIGPGHARIDVGSQHPKGRPDSVAIGHLDPGFHIAILESHALETRRVR
jgi:hypothetical protein